MSIIKPDSGQGIRSKTILIHKVCFATLLLSTDFRGLTQIFVFLWKTLTRKAVYYSYK